MLLKYCNKAQTLGGPSTPPLPLAKPPLLEPRLGCDFACTSEGLRQFIRIFNFFVPFGDASKVFTENGYQVCISCSFVEHSAESRSNITNIRREDKKTSIRQVCASGNWGRNWSNRYDRQGEQGVMLAIKLYLIRYSRLNYIDFSSFKTITL